MKIYRTFSIVLLTSLTLIFFDGRVGYDVQYMDQDELIADMLKQYERYLSLLDDVGQELMAHEQTELSRVIDLKVQRVPVCGYLT